MVEHAFNKEQLNAPDKTDPNAIGAVAAGIAAAAGMFQSAAVVGALVESGVIDPQKVAAWAEMFADGQSQKLSPDVREAVAQHLKGFASLIRSMPTKPPGAGNA